MKTITVIHIVKSEGLVDHQRYFLKQLFRLKTDDEFNINKALIEISLFSKVKRSFGNKPHKLLIFYDSPIKLTRIKTDFLQVLNSVDDRHDFDKLTHDPSYFIIGNSRIARLDINEATRINSLLASLQFVSQKPSKKPKSPFPCSHYKSYVSPSKKNR
jgi:hypothetical protein